MLMNRINSEYKNSENFINLGQIDKISEIQNIGKNHFKSVRSLHEILFPVSSIYDDLRKYLQKV